MLGSRRLRVMYCVPCPACDRAEKKKKKCWLEGLEPPYSRLISDDAPVSPLAKQPKFDE
jgi:hypothetical protein